MPLPLPDAALGCVARSRSLPRWGPGVLLLPSQKGAPERLFRYVHPKQGFLPCWGGGWGWRWSGCRSLPDLLLVSWGLPIPPPKHGSPQDTLSRWVSLGSWVQEGGGGSAWTQLEGSLGLGQKGEPRQGAPGREE